LASARTLANEKEKQRARIRAHYRANKKVYFLKNRTKKEKLRQLSRLIRGAMGCQVCQNRDWRVLDFHHRNRKGKKANVSDLCNSGWATFFREVAKCIVLCRNCHGRRTQMAYQK
jgi:hypothetical protein